jgi:hypothetical protein
MKVSILGKTTKSTKFETPLATDNNYIAVCNQQHDERQCVAKLLKVKINLKRGFRV